MTSEPKKKWGNDFMEQLSTDTELRNQFLEHPVDTLRAMGVPVRKEQEKPLEDIIGYLKDDIKHIFEIPAGYQLILSQGGFGIRLAGEPEFEPTDKIIP